MVVELNTLIQNVFKDAYLHFLKFWHLENHSGDRKELDCSRLSVHNLKYYYYFHSSLGNLFHRVPLPVLFQVGTCQ